jgi:hypothetical protein
VFPHLKTRIPVPAALVLSWAPLSRVFDGGIFLASLGLCCRAPEKNLSKRVKVAWTRAESGDMTPVSEYLP